MYAPATKSEYRTAHSLKLYSGKSAAKIAAAVEAGLDGYEMAKTDLGFVNGEGIIGADVEQTIFNVGRMARQGMRHTDEEILNIMLGL